MWLIQPEWQNIEKFCRSDYPVRINICYIIVTIYQHEGCYCSANARKVMPPSSQLSVCYKIISDSITPPPPPFASPFCIVSEHLTLIAVHQYQILADTS